MKRLVIRAPVEHIAQAKFLQQARRLEGFGQRRSKPALDFVTGRGRESLDDFGEILSFGVDIHSGLQNGVALPVCQPYPISFVAGFDDLRVMLAAIRIEQDRCPHLAFVEGVDHAPDADAYAVVTPAEVEWIGNERRRSTKDAG